MRTATTPTAHHHARRRTRVVGATALVAAVAFAAPAAAVVPDAVPAAVPESVTAVAPLAADDGYEVILDGTQESFDRWAYAGNGGFDLVGDGTVRSRVGAEGGFGTLWYPVEEYGDFSLKLEFRDDAPGEARANSGVQVRFPELWEPNPECSDDLAWIAVACGHEVQINDSPEGGSNDPRKTGSIYGFADLDLARAMPTEKGTWNEYEIRVVGQHYTVIRNGVVINEYENVPGVPFPGRPDDPGSSARGLVGYIGLQAHGSAPDVISFRDVKVRELPPVDVSVDARCMAGTAVVAVRAENVGDAPVDVTLGTPTGERAFTGVQAGRNAYQAFSTRSATAEAGTATMTVTTDGGEPVVVDTPYAGVDCG